MKILFGVVAVAAIVLGLGAVVGLFLPAQVEISTSVTINAPAAEVFPYINDLGRWEEWTAWTKEQYPDMKRSFGAVKEGKGGSMSWEEAGGAGQLEIVSSEENKSIEFDLSFEGGEPWRGLGGGDRPAAAQADPLAGDHPRRLRPHRRGASAPGSGADRGGPDPGGDARLCRSPGIEFGGDEGQLPRGG